jgi:hypothetical protein
MEGVQGCGAIHGEEFVRVDGGLLVFLKYWADRAGVGKGFGLSLATERCACL